MEPTVHSAMPKGWSSMAGFVSAPRQRLRPWGEVRLQRPSRARGVCSGRQGLGRGRSGAIQFCPAYPVGSVWRCRKASHRWREVCLPCDKAVARGVRCVLAQPRATGVCPGSRFCPERGSSGRWRLSMQRAAGLSWVGWIGLSVDQNRHSRRSAAQPRNPCPVERGWIPAVAGMTIRSGVPCQRAVLTEGLSIIRHSRLRFWRVTRKCHDQSHAHRNADANPTFQKGFRYLPGRQGTHPDAPEVS